MATFEPGEIVVQAWAWIGTHEGIYPFWQVRFSEVHHGAPDFYCCPVPYGEIPGEAKWFDAPAIMHTGLSWRIPTWAEIAAWSNAAQRFRGQAHGAQTTAASVLYLSCSGSPRVNA